jgi:hypothetical protein
MSMTEKKLSDLTIKDLGKVIGIDIGWEQVEKGKLTDFYGSMDDELNAIVAVEIDENLTFFLPPDSKIYI